MVGERVIIGPAVKPRRPASPDPRDRVRPTAPGLLKDKAIHFLHILGWRQPVFALGLAFCLGGIGDAIDSAFMLFIGGLLLGLALRIPWLKG